MRVEEVGLYDMVLHDVVVGMVVGITGDQLSLSTCEGTDIVVAAKDCHMVAKAKDVLDTFREVICTQVQ